MTSCVITVRMASFVHLAFARPSLQASGLWGGSRCAFDHHGCCVKQSCHTQVSACCACSTGWLCSSGFSDAACACIAACVNAEGSQLLGHSRSDQCVSQRSCGHCGILIVPQTSFFWVHAAVAHIAWPTAGVGEFHCQCGSVTGPMGAVLVGRRHVVLIPIVVKMCGVCYSYKARAYSCGTGRQIVCIVPWGPVPRDVLQP